MKSIILILTVCRRPLAYFCILNQNVPKYVPKYEYFINLLFIISTLSNYYGAPTWGSMPHQGPWSQYVHCKNNMLANLKHNASALFWYTQQYHRSKGHVPWTTIGGYCAQPPRSKSHGKQASPLQEGALSTGRAVRVSVVGSFGGSFV